MEENCDEEEAPVREIRCSLLAIIVQHLCVILWRLPTSGKKPQKEKKS